MTDPTADRAGEVLTDTTADRGQVILVAAFALAVAFVALALILNAAIFTGSLATRGENAATNDALVVRDTVRDDVAEFVRFANWVLADEGADDYGTLASNVSTAIDQRSNLSARLQFQRGRVTNQSMIASETVNGTRIVHNDTTADFRSDDGSSDWLVVEDVDRTRDFDVKVVNDADNPTDFNVSLNETDGNDDDWFVKITDTGSDVQVEVFNETAGAPYTCTHSFSGSSFWVNLTDGTVAGTECDVLRWGDNVDQTYNISYANANEPEGRYSLVVDNTTLATQEDTNDDYNAVGSPSADHATYSVTVEYVYESQRLYYRTDIRVAPGERDD